MAGVMALINQHAGAAQGLPNAELYDLAGRQTYSTCSSESGSTSNSCYFNDIDQGTITMPCNYQGRDVEGGAIYDFATGEWSITSSYSGLASPNCSIVNSGDVVGTLSGYSATTGYDRATGLGSLNIANVVSAWPTGAPAPTFSLSATNVSVGAGATSGNTSTITVMPTDGFTGAVGFTCSVTSTPTGVVTSPVTCGTIASATVSGSAEATTTMTVGSTSTTTQGSYVIQVTGTHGAITQYANVDVTIAPTYSVSATSPSSSIAPGSSSASTITVTGSGGYVGNISLNCSMTGGPANSSGDAPSCSVTSGSPVALSATTTSGQATATVNTAASAADLVYPKVGNGKGWLGAGGGAVLALVFFFGIPKRRRSWRAMLGVFVAMATLGVLTSCGGGSAPRQSNPGTTAGTYTFTVTSSTTGATVTPAPTATFQVIVN